MNTPPGFLEKNLLQNYFATVFYYTLADNDADGGHMCVVLKWEILNGLPGGGGDQDYDQG